MKKQNVTNFLLSIAALNTAQLYANSPSKDARYSELRNIMRDYIQQVVREECSLINQFDDRTFLWDEYEIKGLEVILFDTLNKTKDYCKAPDFTGMHSLQKSNNGDSTNNM